MSLNDNKGMDSHSFVANQYSNLPFLASQLKEKYASADPFPHVILDNFFREDVINAVQASFPDLSKDERSTEYNHKAEVKLSSKRGDEQQSEPIKHLLRYLNSSEFVDFLQHLTAIDEPLIPDPHFYGGGLHEIKNGGLLKIHADFCRHRETGLDRRVNLLVYLNQGWREDFGGHLELWDRNMSACGQKILPTLNRVVIFNTTDFTFHGNPEIVSCPPHRSRRSLALYYYSNGRPKSELRASYKDQMTLFKERPGEHFLAQPTNAQRAKNVLRSLVPPALVSTLKGLANTIRR